MSGKMLLMLDTTIAHYKITSKLGQGGMGEVYRAIDTKLDREVAVKVLPESFAQGKERLARFEREAKTLASLNHPNIGGIYGLEQSGSSQALVLELVEGEDLSERLKRGPMPLEKALSTCQQIAEALEAAHAKGIIHRDLKPGNVMVTNDGIVKVLDFGLSKALASQDPNPPSSYPEDSPTLTDDQTQPGKILGTAAYMPPEQARGKPVDKRVDIWSFGCVLFETLAGEKAFPGDDATEILAAIIKGEPRWTALPESVPPTMKLLLRKCLSKDRNRRLHDIADARIDLEETIAGPDSSVALLSSVAVSAPPKRSGVHLASAIGGMVLATMATVALMRTLNPKTPPPDPSPSPIRMIPMDLGAEGRLSKANGTAARLSPDGSTLAYIFTPTGERQDRRIYLRRFDETKTTVLEHSGWAINFRFSPDGEWVVFRTEGATSLNKISVKAGGPAIEVFPTGHTRGMDWSNDGTIIYADNSESGLFRASESEEGNPEALTRLSEGEVTHRWPFVIPGGKAVIFTSHTKKLYGYDDAKIMLLDLAGGEPRVLVSGGFHGRYISSGHLVYIRKNTLFARAFDRDALELRGPEIPVVQNVATQKNGVAHYDVSENGDLVYLKGGFLRSLYTFEWMDQVGNREIVPYADDYLQFRLSPNGRFLACSVQNRDSQNIWIYDIERNNPTQLTFDPEDDDFPVWSPTGGVLVFTRAKQDGTKSLFWIRTNENGQPEPLTESSGSQIPYSWSPDGRYIAITEFPSKDRPTRDVRIVRLEGDDKIGWSEVETTDFRATEFRESYPIFSPDGDWLAYLSNETGTGRSLFVRAFPAGDQRKQISTSAEGNVDWARWSQQTDTLFFGDLRCFSAAHRLEEELFTVEKAIQWTGVVGDEMLNQPNWAFEVFDLDPNGPRALVRKQAPDKETERTLNHIVLFENFFDYLREKVPPTSNP